MMKEKRLGEYGNNVTRILYYLEDSDDNLIDSYEYKAPTAQIIVNNFKFLLRIIQILKFLILFYRKSYLKTT